MASLLAGCSSSSDAPTAGVDAGTRDGDAPTGAIPDGGVTSDAAPAAAATGALQVTPSFAVDPGQKSIEDIAFFAGFSGVHEFGRGAKAPSLPETPTLITDCRLTVTATDVTLEGGGASVTAPLISANPNAKTLLVTYPDSRKLGVTSLLSLYDATGGGINLGITYGIVTSASAGKTGVAIQCNTNTSTSVTTDRLLDTLTFTSSTLAPFLAKAGTGSTYTQNKITPADLGGSAGSAVLGRGVLTTMGGVSRVVDGCTLTVSGGTMTLASGAFTRSATFTGDASDSMLLVKTQTDTQYNFRPADGVKAFFQVNAFGFVTKAQAKGDDGSTLECPN